MKKTFIAISIGIFFLLVSGILMLLSLQRARVNVPSQEIPTPTPIFPATTRKNLLRVQSTNPPDGTTQLSTQQIITITFNKPVTQNDVLIISIPPMNFTQTIQDNMLTLTPQDAYEDGILYTLTIEDAQTQQTLFVLHFSSGTSLTAVPLQDQNIKQDVDTFDKTNYPDVFVANQTPYETKDFSVDTKFINGTPYGHYGIVVTQKNSSGKEKFLDWLKSLGLTDQQISSLDISYN